MSLTELRQQARQRLDSLSLERLRVADDFLAYLSDREAEEATAELLALPGLHSALKEAEEDVRAGRLTPVADLRRKQ